MAPRDGPIRLPRHDRWRPAGRPCSGGFLPLLTDAPGFDFEQLARIGLGGDGISWTAAIYLLLPGGEARRNAAIGFFGDKGKLAEGMGFEPTVRFNPYNDLANRRLQPLGHPSAWSNGHTTFAAVLLGAGVRSVKCPARHPESPI